jgi:hypothetical protein
MSCNGSLSPYEITTLARLTFLDPTASRANVLDCGANNWGVLDPCCLIALDIAYAGKIVLVLMYVEFEGIVRLCEAV